jgi:hypothetical protein
MHGLGRLRSVGRPGVRTRLLGSTLGVCGVSEREAESESESLSPSPGEGAGACRLPHGLGAGARWARRCLRSCASTQCPRSCAIGSEPALGAQVFSSCPVSPSCAVPMSLAKSASHPSSSGAVLWCFRGGALVSSGMAARRTRPFESIIHSSHGASRTRNLASSAGTANTCAVCSCDAHQRGAEETSHLEKEERDTQCKYLTSGPGSLFVELSLFVHDRARGPDAD